MKKQRNNVEITIPTKETIKQKGVISCSKPFSLSALSFDCSCVHSYLFRTVGLSFKGISTGVLPDVSVYVCMVSS